MKNNEIFSLDFAKRNISNNEFHFMESSFRDLLIVISIVIIVSICTFFLTGCAIAPENLIPNH
jgi:hypothetical protein